MLIYDNKMKRLRNNPSPIFLITIQSNNEINGDKVDNMKNV